MEPTEEDLRLYFSEVKNTQHESEFEDEEHILLNDIEQATDFLHLAGLSDLSKLYHEGQEIPETVVNDSVRDRHLTEKQAQTVRSRVRTLNRTLRNRQPRRKQRQDVRDVAWNVETSSTGTRSRSATPDSLDSAGELTSDEEQQSLPHLSAPKGKLKWTSSEPLQNKFSRSDRGDVAHLGSENVVLKGYQPLSEYGSLRRVPRERSGSDPSTDILLKPLAPVFLNAPSDECSQLSRSHTSLLVNANNSKVYITGVENTDNEAVSFEGLLKLNDTHPQTWELKNTECVSIDELLDIEYQYLKPLLYVEVTAIFDQYKINVLKRKASSKRKKGNVFGVNLATLVMRDMPRPNYNTMIPEVYQSVINQLNSRCVTEDGILRLAGQKQKLEYLCKEIEDKFYNNREHVEQILKQATVHELTGVLKKLLRELPNPVFTMELFDMFYKCSRIPLIEDKVKAMNLLVLMLPIEHRNTFRLLLKFFVNIIKHEKDNRMGIHNVAMITAPSFFPPRLLLPKDNNNKVALKQMSKEEMEKQINDAAVCCCIMELLLQQGENLWLIPADLARQAREAQQKAQARKDLSKDKRQCIGKKKLVRSSTQYEPGAMVSPRIKRDLII